MQLVDADKALQVEEAASVCKKHMASGGSAANTIHGLARLGVETAFIGTVGKDSFGDFFENDMTDMRYQALLITRNHKHRQGHFTGFTGRRTHLCHLSGCCR